MPAILKALAAPALMLSFGGALPAPPASQPIISLDPGKGPAPPLPLGVDPRTIDDGMPPIRFEGAATLTVSFGTVFACGEAPEGYHFGSCVRAGIVHMPNPCEYPDQSYARHMCHELAHANGWPATHGP